MIHSQGNKNCNMSVSPQTVRHNVFGVPPGTFGAPPGLAYPRLRTAELQYQVESNKLFWQLLQKVIHFVAIRQTNKIGLKHQL